MRPHWLNRAKENGTDQYSSIGVILVTHRISASNLFSPRENDDIDTIIGVLSKFYKDFASSQGIHVVGSGDEQQIIFGDDNGND